MELSPRGRFIEDVEGNPEDIKTRGEQITTLGQQMLDCADTLQTIKDQALADGNQQGKAIEKLKESIGDSYEVLRQSGELYQPVGPVIRQYGADLAIIQPSLNGHVADCETKWATYQSLPGDADGSTTPEAGGGFLGMGGYDADSPEAEEAASDNAAKKAAYDDWHESAVAFDLNYNSWEQAFDDAANGVEDSMSDSIKDEFWKSFLGGLATALQWAALVAGVLALVLAGPFAAIALAIGLALLAVTLIQKAMGDASWTDVGFAVLGVLPFGKAGVLFQKGGRLAFMKETFKPLKDLGQFSRINAVNRLGNNNISGFFRAAYQNGNQQGAADILPRILFGKDASGFDKLATLHLSDVASSLWDVGHSAAGQYLKYNSWAAQVTGGESWKKQFPALDVLW